MFGILIGEGKLNDSKTRGHDYRFSRENFGANRENGLSRFVILRHKFFLNLFFGTVFLPKSLVHNP